MIVMEFGWKRGFGPKGRMRVGKEGGLWKGGKGVKRNMTRSNAKYSRMPRVLKQEDYPRSSITTDFNTQYI